MHRSYDNRPFPTELFALFLFEGEVHVLNVGRLSPGAILSNQASLCKSILTMRRASVCGARARVHVCVAVTRKMLLREWPQFGAHSESQSSARASENQRACGEMRGGIIFKSPHAAGTLWDVFAWCIARRFRFDVKPFQCDICFSFVFHIIETPSVWNQPPRVVQAYAVGSFHPKKFSLSCASRESARSRDRAFSCLKIRGLAVPGSFCMRIRSRSSFRYVCIYVDIYTYIRIYIHGDTSFAYTIRGVPGSTSFL